MTLFQEDSHASRSVSWVVGENVAGIVNMALDQAYADLENAGYTVQAFIIPACAVNAPHRRDRCAIVAHAESVGQHRVGGCRNEGGGARSEEAQLEGRCDVLSNSNNGGWPLWGNRELSAAQETGGRWANHGGGAQEHVTGERRSAQPGLGGVADGASRWLDRGMSAPGYWMPEPDISRLTTKREHRKDRLQCLGNAVVPQQFYPVFRAIAESERLEALYD